jgi:dihydropteroate synthase
MVEESKRGQGFRSASLRNPPALHLPRGRSLRFDRMPLVMGIVNVTPDSFSDGGVHFDHTKAVHAAMQMEEDGATIIDVGGESTRPGAAEVSADEETARVVPVIQEIRSRSDVTISIDTRKSDVASAALAAGADIINDVSALRDDARMAALAAKNGVPVILMHRRGDARTMQKLAVYDDVVADVKRELTGFREAALAAGIEESQILVDPGIGFAKNLEHNLELLARADELATIAPLVIGASRKAFVGHITGRAGGPSRAVGSLAAVAAAERAGAAVVRVHDVRETVDFIRVLLAIEERRAQ